MKRPRLTGGEPEKVARLWRDEEGRALAAQSVAFDLEASAALNTGARNYGCLLRRQLTRFLRLKREFLCYTPVISNLFHNQPEVLMTQFTLGYSFISVFLYVYFFTLFHLS